MGIRIQPQQFQVPKDDPFANDTLGRLQPAEVLTHLIGALDGPCVLAVDAAWGAGKTTFLRMWAGHLRKLGFPVVEFNAWETDFTNDPFLALSEELTAGLRLDKDSLGGGAENLRTATQNVLRQAGPRLAQAVVTALLGSGAGELARDTLTSLTDAQMSRYGEAKQAITEFRQTLGDVADALSADHNGRPLVVVVDELDRCRPSYAIELLETAKHLFAVDRVVFVLAVNRAQLAESVRALYGSGFNSEGYLRRFFDLDFRLPEPNREAFIDALIHRIAFDDYFKRTQDDEARNDRGIARQWLLDFFGGSGLSLRTVEQATHRLGLLLASLRGDRRIFLAMATFVLIFRTIDPDLYHRFADGKATDEEVAHAMFTWVAADYRYTDAGRQLECKILMAASEQPLANNGPWAELDTPLRRKYTTLAQEPNSHDGKRDRDREHAADMMKFIQYEQQNLFRRGGPGFRHSVDRLELFSQDLVEQAP